MLVFNMFRCSLNAAIVAGDWNLEFVNNFIEIVRIGVEQTVGLFDKIK